MRTPTKKEKLHWQSTQALRIAQMCAGAATRALYLLENDRVEEMEAEAEAVVLELQLVQMEPPPWSPQSRRRITRAGQWSMTREGVLFPVDAGVEVPQPQPQGAQREQ